MIDDFRPVRRKKSLDPNTNPVSKETEPVIIKPTTVDTVFQTPEQIAADDVLPQPDEAVITVEAPLPTLAELEESVGKSKKHGAIEKLKLRWPPTKKEAIVFVAIALIFGSGIGGWALTRDSEPVAAKPTITKPAKKLAPPAPTTVASLLSGVQVDPAINARPVIGVMIENSLDARPQSGMSQAGVVFEAIAEGGITRFLNLFQDGSPADIGPVRSVRPYYVQWAQGFDAPIVHVGGSPDGLAAARAWKDLDQFSNAGPFRRITTRQAPHNVYTTYDGLLQLASSKGYTSSKFTSFTRKKDAPSKTPTAKTIDVAISGPLYNSHYDYDAVTNTYKRSQNGGPHMDALTNAQLSPKVVIALVLSYGISGGKYSEYGTTGSGQAIVFQDGVATQASWTRADNASNYAFTDANGQPLALNAGQTWITAVSAPTKVTYAP